MAGAVEQHRVARERTHVPHDLAAKNAELERALAHLRAAQDDLVREETLRAQIQRYVSPRLGTLRSPTPAG